MCQYFDHTKSAILGFLRFFSAPQVETESLFV